MVGSCMQFINSIVRVEVPEDCANFLEYCKTQYGVEPGAIRYIFEGHPILVED